MSIPAGLKDKEMEIHRLDVEEEMFRTEDLTRAALGEYTRAKRSRQSGSR